MNLFEYTHEKESQLLLLLFAAKTAVSLQASSQFNLLNWSMSVSAFSSILHKKYAHLSYYIVYVKSSEQSSTDNILRLYDALASGVKQKMLDLNIYFRF